MDQTVPFQFVLDAKAAAAHVAGVWLLAGVLGQVQREGRPRAKLLIAVVALVREHVRVRSIVNEQRRPLLERFPADVAHVGTFASMDSPVILDAALRRERPAANVAGVVLYPGVGVSQVSRQTLVHAELLAAEVASVRSFTRVYPYVPRERVRRVKILAALVAVIINPPVDLHLGAPHHFPIGASKLLVLPRDGFRMRLGQMHFKQFFLRARVIAVYASVSRFFLCIFTRTLLPL